MFNNLNVTLKKIMVVFLIITLTYANLVLVGCNIVKGLISYAANEVEGNEATENNNTSTVGEEETEEEEAEEETEEETPVLSIENKDIHKTKVSEDGEVEYTGKLKVDLNQITDTTSVTLEDVSKELYNSDETLNEDIILKYKTTVINKEDLLKLLDANGKLVVKDTLTNKVLVELTSNLVTSQELDKKVEQEFEVQEDLGENEQDGFSEERSYVTVTEETVEIEYVLDVTNIKFEITIEEQETSNTEPIEGEEPVENETEPKEFVIENTKTISNIDNVEDLDYLQENIKYIINGEEQTANSTIKFKDTITKANLTVDNTEWVVGQANTVKYTITLDTTSEKTEMFVNPMFLIEMPSSVETINTANSEFTVKNHNDAFAGKRVFVTTVLGKKFVVVTLEGAQTAETIANGDTTIDLTLELLVKETATEGNDSTKLYYQNDTVTAYESGKGFDTAQVTVSMIMESEPKDEISETNNDISLSLMSSSEEVIKQGDEYNYIAYLYNFGNVAKENLQINCILPEGISFVKVLELNGTEENQINAEFNETSRLLTINIDKIEGFTEETIEDQETGEVKANTTIGYKTFKIVVKADMLPAETYSREIKNKIKVIEGNKVLAESEEVVNTISDSFLVVETENAENVKEGQEITLGVKITNKGLIASTGKDILIQIPEEMSVSRYSKTVLTNDGQEESKTEGTLSTDLEEDNLIIQPQKTYYFQIIGTVNSVEETKQISITGTLNNKDFSWTMEVENDPEEPNDPENPTDPEDPNDPEGPQNPNDPENPKDPEKPGETGNPEDKEEVFDLSLNQYLNKVTVTNAKGTTTYEYKDTNFAKVEIHSKQMNGSKVTLEYKIVVKNEGTIPGYARKIVDYIPEDLKFNEELNEGWYLGDDGNIYTVALIDKLLNPGETAEVSIILEKQMTNENVGTTTNLVEIYEASNDKNVEDINSTPADRAEGQNDISKVEVMVVTSTGTIILYTTLVIAVISIIGFGFYKIKKVTLNKKGGC